MRVCVWELLSACSMAKPEIRDEEAVERVMDVMLSLCSMVARASSTVCPLTAWCLRC